MIAPRKPDLKVLVLIESDGSLGLRDLALLADRGLVPADRDPGLVLGCESAVFASRLDKWMKARPLPKHLSGRILDRFAMTGVYRVGFRVEARFPNVTYGQSIRFSFGFRYRVDMRDLLDHDLILAGKPLGTALPSNVRQFLEPGHKINPKIPSAVAWAAQGGSKPPDAQKEYGRLKEFIKRTVAYDKKKRAAYFGGKMVYPDLELMYQDVGETLARQAGCCPDTILLECAFLRARGVPCLTAGRFGHFYTMLYVPGRGWMSTSVTPTGIPLIRSPGPDHVPYQRWQPKIPLTTTHWEARVRINPLEE